ncbi:unnamed protein product, partial [Timema podura]|nr:unnamed protein product [Timema podura]
MDCRAVQAVERVGGAACAGAEERDKGRLNSEGQQVLTARNIWEKAHGERHGMASQPTKVSFRANKNRWITETVDGASYRTGLVEKIILFYLNNFYSSITKNTWSCEIHCLTPHQHILCNIPGEVIKLNPVVGEAIRDVTACTYVYNLGCHESSSELGCTK